MHVVQQSNSATKHVNFEMLLDRTATEQNCQSQLKLTIISGSVSGAPKESGLCTCESS